MDLSAYRFSKDHEWVKVENGVATVGITDHAQQELGDIVFVELPEVGAALSRGDTAGSVESVKAVSDVYCPVSGEVVEVNAELETSPELVNQSPYEKGWMFKVKLSDESELEELMDSQAYEKFLSE